MSLAVEAGRVLAPFTSLGGAGRAYRVFGPELSKMLDELNEALAA